MDDYQKTKAYWDDVFAKMSSSLRDVDSTGYAAIDEGLDWIGCKDGRFLDFGCGSGMMLLRLAKQFNAECVAVDLSGEALKTAEALFALSERCATTRKGSVEILGEMPEQSFDGVILSNILDNLSLEVASRTLEAIARILKADGRVFVKVNAYLERPALEEGLEHVEGPLYQESSGLYLLNLDDDAWRSLFSPLFYCVHEHRVHLGAEGSHVNRIYLLKKKEGRA